METSSRTPDYYNPPAPRFAFRETPLPAVTSPRMRQALDRLPSASPTTPPTNKPAAKVAIPSPSFEDLVMRIQSLQIQKRDLRDEVEPRGRFGFAKKVSNWFRSKQTEAKRDELSKVEASLNEATRKLEELQNRRSLRETPSSEKSQVNSLAA